MKTEYDIVREAEVIEVVEDRVFRGRKEKTMKIKHDMGKYGTTIYMVWMVDDEITCMEREF